MNNDVLAFAQVMAVLVPSIVVLMTAGAVLNWFVRRSRKPEPRLHTEDSLRLERLEHAVDAIAVEVERISEAQRFTTKLLAERTEARQLK